MIDGPNAFAYLVLGGWSLLCFLLPLRLRAAKAVSIGMVGGVLLLPQGAGWDVPALPPLTSYTLPGLCLLLGLLAFRSRELRATLPGSGFDVWMLLLLCAAAGTVATNPDPLVFPLALVEGLRPYDWASQAAFVVLTFWIPFYLGRVCFRSGDRLYVLFQIVVIAALGYSLLALWELRMSPQLHKTFFGFHQHSFAQAIRGGGFRPMVFMSHGLSVADFFFTAALFALILVRRRLPVLGLPSLPVAAWLWLLLLALRSLGALLLGVMAAPVAWFARPQRQLWVAVAVSLVVAFYFVGRAAEVLPLEGAVALASRIDENRGASLLHRLENETILFAKARERILFGWGPRGRSRVYDETGRDITVSDGYWIIMLGREGALGLLCRFGVLLGPVWLAHRRRQAFDVVTFRLVAGLALLNTFKGVDMILNAITVTPLTVLFAGALAGCVEQAGSRAKRVRRMRRRSARRARRPVGDPRGRPPEQAAKPPVPAGAGLKSGRSQDERLRSRRSRTRNR